MSTVPSLSENTAPDGTDVIYSTDGTNDEKVQIKNLLKGSGAEVPAAKITGTVAHEQGGLEADVSAYSGLVKITGGATSAVTAPAGAIVGTTDAQTLSNKTIGAATISGTIAAADNNFERVELKDYAITFSAIGNTGSTQTFDLETANAFSATLDQASAFTFSNPPATGNFGSFVLELTNGDAYTITWPASVDWAGGSAPTLTSSGVDILAFVTRDGGTTWHGYVMSTDSK